MQKDYFSKQAQTYLTFRPRYPDELFRYLFADAGPEFVVWDCATGNGQAACAMAPYAETVIASDLSHEQLCNASSHEQVSYIQAVAESMPLADSSIDLITVAQALHWFDFERFYAEARRVMRPNARIAVWTYSFLSVVDQLGDDIDRTIRWFYHDIVGPYWPPERRWVDEQYATIPFPFTDIAAPRFYIKVSWDLSSVLGYIRSWSAVQRYIDTQGNDPMPDLDARLRPLWGDPAQTRDLKWTLALRVGR